MPTWLRPLPALDDGPPLALSLWPALAGAGCLVIPWFAGLTGPDRAPRGGALVAGLALLAAVLGAGISAWPGLRRSDAPAVIGALGLGLMALALAIIPESFAFPTAGIGDRLFGFPALIGAPFAGAGFLSRRPFGRIIGGSGACLVLVGLLQPFPILDDTQPALFHLLDAWQSPDTGLVVALLLAAVLGLGAAAAPDSSPLHLPAGAVLAAVLPAWQLVRLLGGDAPAEAGSCLALLVGGTLWLTLGLRSGIRESPGPVARWLPAVAEGVLVVGALGLFLMLKLFSTRWSTTDENIYFYGSVLVAKGQLPYRDFFFSHPPMHLVVPGLLFKIFGFSLGLAKTIPVAAATLTGLLMWLLARQRVGRLAAFFTLLAFLFAHELLQGSTNMNGVELTSLWLTGGTCAFAWGRPVLAGMLLGLAVTTGFYAIAGALAIIALAFARDARFGLQLFGGFAAVGGGINLIFWLVGGDAFLTGVYGYHMQKDAKPLIGEFLKTLYHHTPLAFGVLLAPVVGAWQRFSGFAMPGEVAEPETRGSFFAPHKLFDEPGLGSVKWVWLVCVTLLIELTLFQELYSFYFVLAFPTAAYCTGYVLAGLVGATAHGVNALVVGSGWVRLGVAAALLVGWSGWIPAAVEANWVFSNPGRGQDPKPAKGMNPEWLERGDRREYPWIEPAALSEISGPIVRSLFWRDHRLKGALVPGYRHYLWQKALHLDAADAIGEWVKANSAPDETVAGNSLVAPLVALVSDRRLAGDIIDTNGKVFRTGLVTAKDFFEAICKDKIRYLVASPSGYFNNALFQQLPVVRNQFDEIKSFPSPMNKFDRPGVPPFAVTLWEVRNKTDNGPRCQWIPSQLPGVR